MAFNRVNPPKQLTLPDKISNDIELKKSFDDRDYILFQIWKRIGAGSDFIDNSLSGLNEFDDLITESAKDQLLFDVVNTAVDYTTIGDQAVICTAALTVTLNDEPDDQERVKVIIANGDVTLNGNGKLINKETDQTVLFKNLVTLATLDIIYIIELDEWFII